MAFLDLSDAGWDAFFPDLCTIEVATQSTNEFSELVEAWAPLEGRVDLGAQLEFKGGKPVTRGGQQIGVSSHEIGLRGHYPDITEAHRAVITGQIYAILVAGSDSQSVKTRLLVEKL